MVKYVYINTNVEKKKKKKFEEKKKIGTGMNSFIALFSLSL